MNIEKAERKDLQKILDLQYLAYQSEAKLFNNMDIPPLKQTLEEVFDEYQKGIILKALDEEGKIIGSVRGYLEDGTVHIGKLMVHPQEQGKGIGTKLLVRIEEEFPDCRYELFTSTKSKRNIELYEKLGYKVFAEKKITEELRFVYLEKDSYAAVGGT
ncbi:MAG: GNAT family N-acetyltransferase [Lachnospiraceae bacterium]